MTKIKKTKVINNPKNEKTEIVCILDRSGSMNSIIEDAIGGFNSFINEQKKEDTPATITVVLFDDFYELLYDNVDIKEVKEITSKEWSPRGTTALFDAVGKTINTIKSRHKLNKKDRPDKVLVCIITDGQNNASKEYDAESIKSLIKNRENKNWSFVFLAADQDAMTAGSTFGVNIGNSFNYSNTSTGYKTMFNAMSTMTSNIRGSSISHPDYDFMSKNLANLPVDVNKDSNDKSKDKNN